MKHVKLFEQFVGDIELYEAIENTQGLIDAIDSEMESNSGKMNVKVSTRDLRVLKAAASGEKVKTLHGKELDLQQLLDQDKEMKKDYDYLKRKYKF